MKIWAKSSCSWRRFSYLFVLSPFIPNSFAFTRSSVCTRLLTRSSSSSSALFSISDRMPKRKVGETNTDASTMNDDAKNNPPLSSSSSASSSFRETSAADATCLTDGVLLATPHDPSLRVIMPWVGFGTYKLGKQMAGPAVTQAIVEAGYRSIDTAFIYAGETTEAAVGLAIQEGISKGVLQSRADMFITTKHWRKYHGYDATTKCFALSLKRLQLDYIDLYLMHWPGPAYTSMHRKKEVVEADPWFYAAENTKNVQDMQHERAETWRAMEDACRKGSVRAIGVSNMTVELLKKLKETATLWPPAVNQVEYHPLYPQTELKKYCEEEGIVLQAYASLGGQDTGKELWNQLLGNPNGKPTPKKAPKSDLLHAPAVTKLAQEVQATPAQLLLRWGLERGCVIIPKSASKERMLENADIFKFRLTHEQVDGLQEELLSKVKENNPEQGANGVENLTRLCWRNDPFRHLDC
jgi:diketogulonate reductase-like aldo/keto reductase